MDIVVKFVDASNLSYGLYRLVRYKHKFVWQYIFADDREGLIPCGTLLNAHRRSTPFDTIQFMESDLENLC